MKPVRVLLALALSLAAAAAALAGAKKPSAVSIRFYPEAGAEGGSFSQKVALLQSGRETYMGEIPLLNDRDVKSFHSFPAADGSYGVYLQLDDHGTNLLAQHTMSRRGSYVLVFFNGRHVIDLLVDRAVRDGIAVIPSGLSANDVSLLEVTYPRIGHENEKPSRKKAPAAAAKPGPTAKPVPIAPLSLGTSPAMVRQSDGTFAPARSTGQSVTVSPKPLDAVGQPR